jgi:hypothetical protein
VCVCVVCVCTTKRTVWDLWFELSNAPKTGGEGGITCANNDALVSIGDSVRCLGEVWCAPNCRAEAATALE